MERRESERQREAAGEVITIKQIKWSVAIEVCWGVISPLLSLACTLSSRYLVRSLGLMTL